MSQESKAVRLAQYLRDFAQSRSHVVRDVGKYETVLWLDDLPDIPGCVSALHRATRPDDDDADIGIWVQIDDQDLPLPPEPPEELKPWMSESEYRQPRREPPTLRAKATIEDPHWDPSKDDEPGKVTVRLDESPGVERLHQEYSGVWHQWAQSLGPRLKAREYYTKLYEVHRRLRREGEALELRLGFGLLDWPKPGGKGAPIRRHAVTSSVDLQFDVRRGIMRVVCPEEGAKVLLETEVLGPGLLPDQAQTHEVERQLSAMEADDGVWDLTRMAKALQTWGRALHPRTSWNPAASRQAGSEEAPALSWAPALFLRKRGAAPMVRLYQRLIDQLRQGQGASSSGWSALLGDHDDQIRDEHDDNGQVWPDEADETLFPLPANGQQLEIVDALRTRRGVLVQGPPGTGKSHTIANLMCHLLASGQRVLVTAENPRALSVLKDKLPDDLKPLCISVLSSGGSGFAELSATVQEISSRRALWSESEGEKQVSRLRRVREESARARARAEAELRDIRLGETATHTIGIYSGTPLQIAERVVEDRPRHGWMKSEAELTETAPLSNDEAMRWLTSLREANSDERAEALLQLPELTELPTVSALQDLIAKMETMSREQAPFRAELQRDEVAALRRLEQEELEQLTDSARSLREQWRRAPRKAWRQDVAGAARQGHPEQWQPLLERSRQAWDDLEKAREQLGGRDVYLPPERDPVQVRADAQALLEHFASGGKWRSLGGLVTPKAVRGRTYFLDEVTVDASAADEPNELEAVVLEASVVLGVVALAELWEPYEAVVASADREMRRLQLGERIEALEHLLRLGHDDHRLRLELQGRVGLAIPHNWLEDEECDWVRLLQAALLAKRGDESHQRFESAYDHLRRVVALHDAHPEASRAAAAVEARDVARYGEAREEIARWWEARRRYAEFEALDQRLRTGAATVHDAVRRDASDVTWRERLAEFVDAWDWARADHWLQRFKDAGRVMVLERERRKADEAHADATAKLAAQLAWQKFFQRLSPAEDAALKGWLNTVKQMGKGRGRSAKLERLRRVARQYMEECRDAIPAWVMPRYLVADMIDVDPSRFDTVIVDEASQMGVEGLFVFYVGKRSVIVGDDQQISPSDVGVEEGAVDQLRRTHLADFNHAQALGRGGNVYANAQIRFGRSVTLREHFRCMPEIIQFSNDLCYAPNKTPLDPMRSYGDDRLPPLNIKRVAAGRREGGSSAPTNRAEAEEIVAQVEACLDDPAYEGKTIGVISLVGSAQARLIETMLVERIDPQTIEERQILCGDSYTFQGDERHVIFLSMVVSRGEVRLTAQTSMGAIQRFNVAVSRAQDQLWLFHSVDLADLKKECMRYRLISHVSSPQRELVSADTQRFDSPFEEAVFRRIVERGYRARTQVGVGSHSYRIDIVVEGLAGSLAVECDGDRWHGEEEHAHDMARQRDLERVGWEFVRIPGSAFYRDPDAALVPLWDALRERDITPRVSDDVSSGTFTGGHVVTGPADFALRADSPASTGRLGFGQQAVGSASDPSNDEGVQTSPPAAGEPVARAAPAPSPGAASQASPPDPRIASSADVQAALVEVIREYGPIPTDYACRRYVKLLGLGRMGRVLRDALRKALRAAVRSGALELSQELTSGSADAVVRVMGSPAVVVRPLGDRDFDEIPPSEWAERIRQHVRAYADRGDAGQESVFRLVLSEVGFSSLTRKRRPVLEWAWNVACNADDQS